MVLGPADELAMSGYRRFLTSLISSSMVCDHGILFLAAQIGLRKVQARYLMFFAPVRSTL